MVMRRDVDGLVFPPPTFGQDRLARANRGQRAQKTHTAVMQSAPDTDGRVQVFIAGTQTKTAALGAGARGAQPGDRVSVAKAGGEWYVTATRDWHVQSTPSVPAVDDSTLPAITGGETLPDLAADTSAIRTRVIELTSVVNQLLAALDGAGIVEEN